MERIRRNTLLQASDEELSSCCRLEFCRGSGNGGQKRNKTSSAVRVTLKELAISAEDCTERSQKLNRSKALQKLRRKIAMTVRQDISDEIITIVAPSNNRYPLFLARLIDLLSSVNYSFKECGLKLNLSSSQVEKLLRRDASLWQFIQSKRQNENH
jgi:hypothetical protein